MKTFIKIITLLVILYSTNAVQTKKEFSIIDYYAVGKQPSWVTIIEN